jgi:hypothetical protein
VSPYEVEAGLSLLVDEVIEDGSWEFNLEQT